MRWLVLAVLAVTTTAAHGQAIVVTTCGTGRLHGWAAASADDGPGRLPLRVDDDADGHRSPGDAAWRSPSRYAPWRSSKAAHARP